MSSSWSERQGKVGDLRNQSREELQELLVRQEKILSNKRLLQTLPDKGKKIQEFAENVRLAIEQCSELEKRQCLISSARTELESKYQQAFTSQHRTEVTGHAALNPNEDASNSSAKESEQWRLSADIKKSTAAETQKDIRSSRPAAEKSLKSNETRDRELAEAFDRVKLHESGTSETEGQVNSRAENNYFLQKPHYVTVLEAKTSSQSTRQKFKPHQLPSRSDVSLPGSSSPGQSAASVAPLSAQAQKEQDRKHLDDITAAKLPPLHHNPAQLLSLDESAMLLMEQTKKQKELQAKLAAQKLFEGPKVPMESYNPEGGPMAAYREVHDEGALFSEED